MKEAALRDLIAQQINKLKPGLVLLQKEQYIPSEHGTKSFIDLYAKDEKGCHVLIEIKRSTTASRQAIHEINKYVERVKQYFGAKDSEIHVIIASTEWAELLLPFSRFYADASFSIEGIQIDIFQQGIAAIEHAYQQKGIDDYVIVKFYLPDHSTPDERCAELQAQVADILNVSEPEVSDSLLNVSIPVYEYIAYTAVQMLSKDILVKNPNEIRLYFGALETNGSPMAFPQLLQKYYGGNLDALLMSATWGGRDERDSDIIEDIGAQYRSYRSDLSDGKVTEFFTLRDGKWRPCEVSSPDGLFNAYVEKNQTLVKQILLKIHPRDKGILFVSSNADILLEEYVDIVTAKKRNIYYSDAPDVCDICKFPLSHEKFMVDGAVQGDFLWANMCADCFCAYGVKIGWGYGQLYKRETDKWLLVGGFCPDSE